MWGCKYMSDDWKYRDLPRAANGIAPAQWNPDTKQYEVYEGDRRILDKLEWIERRLNDPIDTQLTGSKVEEVVIVDALAITDNTTRFFTFNAEKYTSFYIYAINSLDCPVNITPYEYHNLAVDIWDSSTETFKSVASIQKSIPANRAVPLMDTPGFK